MTTILVVDDEVGVCSVIKHLLVRQGYTVTTISDGRAALEAVVRDEYAAALVDLNLAEIDGNKVMRAARAAKPDVPIIMMSGMALESEHGVPDLLGKSVKLPGIYRLAKPFKPKDLLRLIEEILPHQDIPAPRTAAFGR